MCKQANTDDDNFISSKCNSNQTTTVANDDPIIPTLHNNPLLGPKSPTHKNIISQIQSPQINHQQQHALAINDSSNKEPHVTCTKTKTNFVSSLEEAKCIADIALPMILTGLLLYSRSMISMLFLGRLGELALAGGSLAVGFANITGYSVLSGLAMGMEPICGQAFGAKRHSLLGLTLQRTIILLLLTSIPISFLWLNMENLLLFCRQDRGIAAQAQAYLLYSLPDLLAQSFLHPLRIYLRTQSITLPLTLTAALAIALHLPLNWLLVVKLKLGIKGVAFAGVLTNYNIILFLFIYIFFSKSCKKGWTPLTKECLKGYTKLMQLAIPSCISVCLEWWWYEFMIMLCGLLANPRATIASMGILIQTTAFVYVFPSSLSLGVSTRVGNLLGAHCPGKARVSTIVSLACAVMLGLCAMLFTTLMRHQWGWFFTNDEDILHLTAVALPIIGLCELGNCPQTIGCGVLRGSARPTIGANINLGSFYFVGMPVAIFFGFVLKLGFAGLWLGLLAAQGCCALLMFYVLCRTDWSVQADRAMDLTKSDSSQNTPALPILAPSSYSEISKPFDKANSLETYPLLV